MPHRRRLHCAGAQLTYGLSTEYTNKPVAEGKEKVDADRDVFAKYYVNQILSMEESGIRDAWHRVSKRRRQPCSVVQRCFAPRLSHGSIRRPLVG